MRAASVGILQAYISSAIYACRLLMLKSTNIILNQNDRKANVNKNFLHSAS